MKISGRRITFSKILNELDKLALEFTGILARNRVRYAVVSGYVAILFGRNRSSEDVDIICEKVGYERFSRLWREVNRRMECVITSDRRSAYEDYLLKGTALRFARKGTFIPNIELKFANSDLHVAALKKPVEVRVNRLSLHISPLEQQIAYKLYLGSEKDIEDARFMFALFRDHLSLAEVERLLKGMRIPLGRAKKFLGWQE